MFKIFKKLIFCKIQMNFYLNKCQFKGSYSLLLKKAKINQKSCNNYRNNY